MRYSVLCLYGMITLVFLLSFSTGMEKSFSAGMEKPKSALLPAISPPADVLIIHDSLPLDPKKNAIPPGVLDGSNILDLLGHFGLKGALHGLEDYKANDLNRYRFVIMLSVDMRKVPYPQSLISNVQDAKIPVFWIGNHLSDLTSDPQFVSKIGFQISGPGITQGITTVQYKGTSLIKGDPAISPVKILDSTKAQVLATAHGAGGIVLPHIVRSGNFWYCADTPFGYAEEGDRYLVFCDILHDFFNMPHQEERNALVRLEDITPDDDPEVLKEYADYLYDRKIPFQISLVPIFVDNEHPPIYLSDRPAFVRAIQYMVSKGGSVVMHGVTHQYRGKSTDDYEFWDEFSDRPVPNDSHALIEEKLHSGLDECFKNGIYPLTWETPHYAASQLDYRAIAEYFNSSYDRILSVDRGEAGHYFPYTTTDRFGRFIIPEALGYIPEGKPGEKPDTSVLIKNGERLKVVRDGVASFFFHPFLDIKYLKSCIDGIEGLGYRFISIRDFDLKVQMDSRLIQTYTDTVRLPIKNAYLHRFLLDEKGRRSGESYSQKPQTGIIRDPGIVPPDTILVMEGVSEITAQKEPETPSAWSKIWSKIQEKFSSESGKESSNTYTPTQPQVLLLRDDSFVRGNKNNQESYQSAFADFGFRVSTINWKNYSKSSVPSAETILVVPFAVAIQLSDKQNQWISEFVRDGGNLVIEGPNRRGELSGSRLGELLGIRTEKRYVRVDQVKDGAQQLRWDPPVNVARYSVQNTIAVYAQDIESELPMSALIQYKKGRLLYLAAPLDPDTALGYTRFPYFIHHVLKGFGLRLPMQQSQLELYFDPGGRNRDIDIERLAIDWRKLGVRAIYAAAFQFWPSWSYDYGRLVDICHKNGILVYAWFELPHVSPKFWEDHANWRAKTATGDDGKVGWRYHMDLDIPECQDAAYDFVEDLLKKYPWDGVNIAELNYDTNNGPEDPKNYLPMGATTRSAFKSLGGFDPILLFSPESPSYWKENPKALKKFNDFRSRRVLAWHSALLERITPIAREKDMEMIVTMFDSINSPTVTRDTGVVSHLIVSLMDQFPFTLQVEDPAHFWAENPNRYKQFAETYLKLVRDRKRLMFDVNIVDRDIRHSDAPSQLAVGIELARTVLSASEASGRVGIYSEGTIPIEDLQTLANVLAHKAKLEYRNNSWVTQSEQSVLLTAPGDWQHFKMDNIFWPGWSQNDVFVPSGTHRIAPAEKRLGWFDIPFLEKFRLFDTSILDIRLVHYAGNLDRLTRTDRGLQFSYDSNTRSVALFNKQPNKIMMDGQLYPEQVVSHSGLWSVRLPRGRHSVDVMADSTAIVILEKTSVYSSALIFVFGAVACSLMLLIYFSILARRAVGRTANNKAFTALPRKP
jgi:uncharacterized protein YdaL